MTERELCKIAIKQMKNAYSPYSNFKVGAALLTESGKVFGGCNIENSAFSATVCAERTAIFKAVSEGEKKFEAIAICGGENGNIKGICTPCGVCRQVLSEFCTKDFKVILVSSSDEYKIYTLEELLPFAFEL